MCPAILVAAPLVEVVDGERRCVDVNFSAADFAGVDSLPRIWRQLCPGFSFQRLLHGGAVVIQLLPTVSFLDAREKLQEEMHSRAVPDGSLAWEESVSVVPRRSRWRNRPSHSVWNHGNRS